MDRIGLHGFDGRARRGVHRMGAIVGWILPVDYGLYLICDRLRWVWHDGVRSNERTLLDHLQPALWDRRSGLVCTHDHDGTAVVSSQGGLLAMGITVGAT